MALTRRGLMALAGTLPFLPGRASADTNVFRHGATLFESLKYPADFKNFDYVNVHAPKGGRVRLATLGSFDSVNPFSDKGESASTGVNETLLTRSLDEPSSEYGLLAEGLWFPDDYSRVVYRLRAAARFHDGVAVTPEDVIFSLDALKTNSTQYAAYYKDIVKAEKTGDHEVTFIFSSKGNRELPQITGQLSVLPKHWWTAKDANGKQRSLGATSLEAPLGSGPYAVSAIRPGFSIITKRVEDYWGKDFAVNLGHDNFDEIELQYYQDRAVLLEAFKGDQFDIQLETSSKQWAVGYDFPAANDGRVVREELPRKGVSGMQCWAMNLRRPIFADARVRVALDLAFDFEWSNTNLFYGLYTRARSYFGNSELEANGLPSPDELKLLEPLRGKIPPEVFSTEYQSPLSDTPQARRNNLRKAQSLLAEAGWKPVTDGNRQVLKNDKGETFRFDLVLDSPAFERIALPYKEQLALLGIEANVKVVDSAQYERITESFDFDMTVHSWPQSLSPGNEQREFFASGFADRKQSRNLAGIKDPAVDALVEAIVAAPNRAALISACKALDRVLTWNRFVVPMWFKPADWIAYWKRVRHPDQMPGYALGYPAIWWYDAKVAAELKP